LEPAAHIELRQPDDSAKPACDVMPSAENEGMFQFQGGSSWLLWRLKSSCFKGLEGMAQNEMPSVPFGPSGTFYLWPFFYNRKELPADAPQLPPGCRPELSRCLRSTVSYPGLLSVDADASDLFPTGVIVIGLAINRAGIRRSRSFQKIRNSSGNDSFGSQGRFRSLECDLQGPRFP
jgi:hypothetical protein